jgi:XTP/dITP diphosphohydrolase
VNEFVLATTNAHKADEIRQVLGGYDIVLIDRPAHLPEVDETEHTLEGNALLKALAVARATGQRALADDTGLFVDALAGRPGVFSARYAGEGAAFEKNVKKVLSELEGVALEQRGAHFRTVVAVAEPDGTTWWVDGVLKGRILFAPQGEGGFGYDVIFAPIGQGGRSLGELSAPEKNALSHRGNALRAFAESLENS